MKHFVQHLVTQRLARPQVGFAGPGSHLDGAPGLGSRPTLSSPCPGPKTPPPSSQGHPRRPDSQRVGGQQRKEEGACGAVSEAPSPKNLIAFLDFAMSMVFVKLCKICHFVVIHFLILSKYFPNQCGIHNHVPHSPKEGPHPGMNLRPLKTWIHTKPCPSSLNTQEAQGQLSLGLLRLSPVRQPLPKGLSRDKTGFQRRFLSWDRDWHFPVGVSGAGCRGWVSGTHADADALDIDLHEMEMEVHCLLPLPFFLGQDPLLQELWGEPRTQRGL